VKYLFLALSLAASLLLHQPAFAGLAPPIPIERIPRDQPPEVSAQSWIVFDEVQDVVIAEKDADQRRPMASTTKIMTGLLAFELGDPDMPVVVSERAAAIGEAEVGLLPGETLRLGTLTTALLVRSANDAAMAVAETISGSVESFVEEMNRRAASLGLINTRFANPHGLDAADHYSSARDLLTLARAAMQHEEFAASVGLVQFDAGRAPDGTPRVVETTNLLLLEYQGAFGIKTGYTSRAGLVLVGAAERDARTMYVVVMGSEGERAHFEDSKKLLDYAFSTPGLPSLMTGSAHESERFSDRTLGVAAGLIRLELASIGLLATEPEPEATPEPVAEEPLPGLLDAFSWLWRGAGS